MLLPLVSDKGYHHLKEGLLIGSGSCQLEKDLNHIPIRHSRAYNPFRLMEKKGRVNYVWSDFLKNGDIYFPRNNWDTYVSLFGGNIGDIAFVLQNFNNKKIVLNETSPLMYLIYISLRDNPEATIHFYEKIVSTLYLCDGENKVENQARHYNHLKTSFVQGYGQRPAYQEAAILLFLLHTSASNDQQTSRNDLSSHYSDFMGEKGASYYQSKVRLLWSWHKVLSSPAVKLTHCLDYREVEIPDGRAFIVADTPLFDDSAKPGLCTWSQKSYANFIQYFKYLGVEGHSVMMKTNSNPTARHNFRRKATIQEAEFFFYELDSSSQEPPSLITDQMMRNLNHCVVTNYQLQGLKPEHEYSSVQLELGTRLIVKELASSFKSYSKGLI